MQIELTDEEAKVLINIIDVAIKSKGLEAAESGLHFFRKIKDAIESGQREIENGSTNPAEPKEPA